MQLLNKLEFQHELVQNIELMVSNEDAINNGQLLNFLTYFDHKSERIIEPAVLMEDSVFVRALRTLMFYNALALSLHETQVYAAAVEIFPVNDIPPQYASLLLDIVEHIQANPMQIQPALEQALPEPFNARMDLLKQSILSRLGEHL